MEDRTEREKGMEKEGMYCLFATQGGRKYMETKVKLI